MNSISSTIVIFLILLVSGCATQGVARVDQQVFSFAVPPVTQEYAQRADAMFEILAGELATRNRDYVNAVKHYSSASKLSNNPEVAEQAAKIALYARDFEAAQINIDRWLELSPGDVAAIQLAGLLNIRQNRADKSVEYLSKMIAEDPSAGFDEVERMLAGAKNSKVKLEVMNALRQEYSDVIAGHLAYARLAFSANKLDEALGAVKQVEALDSENRQARLLKNKIRLVQGDADVAIADMRQLVESAGNDDELQRVFARMLVQAKLYDEALLEYGNILKNNPDDADVIYTTALLEMELKRNVTAAAHFKQLLKTTTHVDDASYYLGRLNEDNPEEAIKWYKQVKSGQYFVEAQISVAEMLAEKGETGSARKHLENLRKREAHDGMKLRLYLAEGQLLRKQKRYQEAIKLYDEALEKNTGNIDLLYARGMTGEQSGRLDILERDLNTIISIEPDNATALNALGYTLAEQTDRLEEALDLISKALALEPDDPAIIDSMGWVLYRKGDLEGAVIHLRKAWSILNDPEVASHLATVLWELGKQEQARETVKKALMVSPDDDRLLELQLTVSP